VFGERRRLLQFYRADAGESRGRPRPRRGHAAPITYEVDGEQFIAVLSGWGGAIPAAGRIGQIGSNAI
jgi:hypothetical protein